VETRLARRALRAIAKSDGDPTLREYAVTDVRLGTRGHGVRGRDVVFVEQQMLGLPVYDGRRSVVFGAGRIRVTGRRVNLREPRHVIPTIAPEEAACAAVRNVTERRRLGESAVLSAGAGAERTTAVRIDGVGAPVTAHLVLFGRSVARLAWVVTLTLADGDGFEVLVDATTGRLLRRRQTTDHATAFLNIDGGAGGPALGQPRMTIAFDPDWIGTLRRFDCVNAAGGALTLPGPNAQGDYGDPLPPTVFHRTTLNGFAIANRGFDLIAPFGGTLQARVALTILDAAQSDIGKIASARPHLVRPALKFLERSSSGRHAASDPSVVLHELGHLVLSAGVGGDQVATPFETDGESAAVNEGMADFLGLTLWNAIRRAALGAASDITTFASWVFGTNSRDYTPFLAPGATVPTFPGSGSSHTRGMVICTALLRCRLAIEQQSSAAQADSAMWGTLCAALDVMPHQGDLPRFCCVSRALRDVVPLAHRARLETALSDAGIPTNCPHITPL
jgi:hypothetical protein